MKSKIVLLICLIFIGLISCQKEEDKGYKSFGLITGPDMRMCPSPCCGGWFIQIDSLTYEFDSLPHNSNIDLQNITFPVYVRLDWEFSDKFDCSTKRINIQRISRWYLD